jgi:hypothetical protein
MGDCPATAGSVTYQFRYARPLTLEKAKAGGLMLEKAKAGAFAYTRPAGGWGNVSAGRRLQSVVNFVETS